jgi:hypothetical protein
MNFAWSISRLLAKETWDKLGGNLSNRETQKIYFFNETKGRVVSKTNRDFSMLHAILKGIICYIYAVISLKAGLFQSGKISCNLNCFCSVFTITIRADFFCEFCINRSTANNNLYTIPQIIFLECI